LRELVNNLINKQKMNYEYKFKEITGFEAYEDNNLRPKVPSDYYVEWLEEQLSIHGVVVPKGTLCDHPFDKVTYFMDNSAECECGANLEI
jgi:hypothetical protein